MFSCIRLPHTADRLWHYQLDCGRVTSFPCASQSVLQLCTGVTFVNIGHVHNALNQMRCLHAMHMPTGMHMHADLTVFSLLIRLSLVVAGTDAAV